jgi:hypothetical protein
MFDDLTDAQLVTLRSDLRTALIDLASGKKAAEVKYADTSRKFHPADIGAVDALLNRVIAEIARRAGTGSGGALFPVTG